MTTPSVQALLFDLDGTLIDSMPHHQSSWIEWHRSRGLPFDDQGFFASTAGRTNVEILSELYPKFTREAILEAAEDKERLYRDIARTELAMIKGFDTLHAAARARGLKLAICTAAPRENMAVAFEKFGLDHKVDTITSPADGLRGKPHPDIFVEAARRLGVDPARCIVFEDAPLGVEAARNAGMRAVVLTTTMPLEAFAAYDNVVANAADFVGFDLEALLQAPPREQSHA